MILFYLKTAWRNLKKYKLISAINIGGLAIGLTCSIFAIYYSYNELTYEDCHEKADRVSQVYTYGNFGSFNEIPQTFLKVGEVLKSDYPEVENVAITNSVFGIVMHNNKPFNQSDILLAQPTLNEILTLTYNSGEAPVASQEIALSKKMAYKYFGDSNPIGQSLNISIHGIYLDYTVTGIFNNLPDNTHAKISCHIPLSVTKQLNWDLSDYDNVGYNTYVLTKPLTDIRSLNTKIAKTYDIPVDIEDTKIALVPIKRIHLYGSQGQNNMANLMILLIGGIIALVLSCVSYINLNNIIASTRHKELGIRKAAGCGKSNITKMLLAESALTTVISMVIAISISAYLMPHFNSVMMRELTLVPATLIIFIIVSILVLVSVISGLIPAYRLQKTKPVNLIGAGTGKPAGKVKHGLLTLQFVIAIVLLQFIIISNRQAKYMFRDDVIKCNADNVFLTNGWFWGELPKVKDELLKSTAIESVTWGNAMPGFGFNITNSWKAEGNTEMAQNFHCSPGYTDVFKIKMKEGRFFSDEFSGDDGSVVINNLVAQSLNLDDPVGKNILFNDKQFEVIGVIDDYQSMPVVFEDMPLIIQKSGNYSHHLMIRANKHNVDEAKAYINELLTSINPDYPIDLRTYDDHVIEMAKSYIATEVLMKVFTLVVIVNAMLGLFGLSLFISQFRNKEVGVRKVCGATNMSIVWKLSKGFAIKLLIALLIATPISVMAGQGYVSTFTKHISMTPDIFILGGTLAALMVMLSVGFRIGFAARRNPVEVLRYE